MFEGFLTNVRYLPGARLVAEEDRGRGRRREVYRAPKSIFTNKPIVIVSFTNSGSMLPHSCMVRGEGVECYFCPRYENIFRELASRFKFIGGEGQLAEFYINFIPKLVNEIKRVLENRTHVGYSLPATLGGSRRPSTILSYPSSHQWF